jgi:hypothetical protein
MPLVALRNDRAANTTGKSELDIAEAIGVTPGFVVELLEEDCERGIVVRTVTGWMLSREAERRFGPALRELGDGPLDLRLPRSRRTAPRP